MVPTFRHVFHDRKFQAAFVNKSNLYFFLNNKHQILKTVRINPSQMLVSKGKQFWQGQRTGKSQKSPQTHQLHSPQTTPKKPQ